MTHDVTLASGVTIQMASSGNGNPPDRQGGQATQCSTLWVRESADRPWRRTLLRSRVMAMRCAARFETAAEAVAYLTGEDLP